MSLSSLFTNRLPINRKEVYYTATVFPGIVCSDGFAHIHRLWKLLDIEAPRVSANPETANIQFLTEYNARDAIYLQTDKDRFPMQVLSADTPDILILVEADKPLIVSIEAKMFDTVTRADLAQQMERQRDNVLERIGHAFGEHHLVQVALLPKKLVEALHLDAHSLHPRRELRGWERWTVLAWEALEEEFGTIPSAAYFCSVLKLATSAYSVLRNNKLVFHANMEAILAGQEIFDGFREKTLGFVRMGRKDGLKGTALAEDISTGRWRTQKYELNNKEEPNSNWFLVEEFVEKIDPRSPSS